MNQKRKQQSFQNLLDIKEIFDKVRIQWWIQNGFLLGLYRDGDAIEGDENDVDIGMQYDDIDLFITNTLALEEKNFRVRITPTPHKDGSRITATLKRNATKMHIHFNCEKGDIIYQAMDKSGRVFVFPKEVFKEFGEIEWRGVKFNCPKNIEDYLVARYGETWITPILKKDGWDFYTNKKLNPCYRDKL